VGVITQRAGQLLPLLVHGAAHLLGLAARLPTLVPAYCSDRAAWAVAMTALPVTQFEQPPPQQACHCGLLSCACQPTDASCQEAQTLMHANLVLMQRCAF